MNPDPTQTKQCAPSRPNVAVILLAAGASSRMQGVDKLMQDVGGEPLLRKAARTVRDADAKDVFVVLPPENEARRLTLSGLDVTPIESPDWQEGMSASIRAGMGALSTHTDAVIIALADMPDVTQAHLNALMAAYDPSKNREICRPLSADGNPGHPVLFGRRFFDSLRAIDGDQGGRDILRAAPEYVFDVKTSDQSVTTDLDTPKDWSDWRNGASSD